MQTITFLIIIVIYLIAIPLFILLSLLNFLFAGLPIIYSQKRIGKNGIIFTMYKFRTMVNGAEKQKIKLVKLNEVDGPVFKIYNDPRFTVFGKILSRTGLDELPQLFNILKREMNLVGPRPLPVDEARKIPSKYRARQDVLPGIVSPWVVGGMHKLKFKRWMNLDLNYVSSKNSHTDLSIIIKSFFLILKNIYIVLIGK